MNSSVAWSPGLSARIAGTLYLAIILLGAFGETVVRGTLVIPGDPAATVQAISASPLLWRAGIVGDLLMHVCDVPVIVFFYLLLKPVNRGLALLSTLLNLVQTAVLVANKMTLLVPLFLFESGRYLKLFAAEQLQAVAYLAINAHGYGFAIGLIFFGFACVVRGFLIFKSDCLPKVLGVLIVVAGLSYLLNSFALLLAPDFASLLFPAVLLPALVGELSLCLWLIAKGVKPPSPEQSFIKP